MVFAEKVRPIHRNVHSDIFVQKMWVCLFGLGHVGFGVSLRQTCLHSPAPTCSSFCSLVASVVSVVHVFVVYLLSASERTVCLSPVL